MNAAVVDTSVLIDFLGSGASSDMLRGFDRLLIPAAVDAEFRAGLDPDTRAGRACGALLDEFLEEPTVESSVLRFTLTSTCLLSLVTVLDEEYEEEVEGEETPL